MTLEDRETLYRAVDLPDNIGPVRIDWRDDISAEAPVDRVREDLFKLIGKVSREIRLADSVSVSLSDFAGVYPHLAAVAKSVLVMPASQMGAEMRRLAREYEQSGGKLLTAEEIRKEIAERRGAA